MRRFIVLLMIALLPLRAWAGDAMALQMAGVAKTVAQVEASIPAPCPMHASAPMASHHGDTTWQMPSSSCNACDLCLPMAELATVELAASSTAQHVMRPAPAVASLGIAPPPQAKPPIS